MFQNLYFKLQNYSTFKARNILNKNVISAACLRACDTLP